MAKKSVQYQVSMEKIHEFVSQKEKKLFKKPDFSRFLDPVYRRYLARRTVIYIIISAFCVAFMLLMSASTSPLYTDYCDGDSSIFMLIGKAISQGMNVYTDYFDHKGPILFYLNALGFALTGTKVGVFIIQCVFLSLTAIFMYKTARIFTKTVGSLVCVAISILAFASTISDGNLSEEYCMLFCMIPVYLSVKHMTRTPDEVHPAKYIFIYGVCFGLCAFTRINNGFMICGIAFIAFVTDFIHNNIKTVFKSILFFILGILTVTIPICTFFLIKGTLSDMIFATFTFNLLYAAEGSTETSSAMISLLQWALPVLVLILTSCIFAKRLGARVASLITTLSVFSLIPIMLGYGYTHYYTTLIPIITLYCAVFFYLAGRRSIMMSILLCAVMVLPLHSYFITLPSNTGHYIEKLEKQDNPQEYKDIHSDIHYSATALSERIPEEDKNSVFGYDVSAAWFLQADIMPCHRLFTLQESWARHYPEFGREINQMLLDSPPKWVIIHNIDIIESRQFLKIINDRYELDSEFSYDLLYKLKN